MDKSSEVCIIDAKVEYKVVLLTKRCKFLLGLEVLDKETRDEMRERGEIEWDNDVECDVVGGVTAEVRGEGNVGGDEGVGEDGEEKKEPATPSRFKHGDAEDPVDEGEGGASNETAKEGDGEDEVKTQEPKKNGKAKK